MGQNQKKKRKRGKERIKKGRGYERGVVEECFGGEKEENMLRKDLEKRNKINKCERKIYDLKIVGKKSFTNFREIRGRSADLDQY